jgi:hypothetical protein
MTTQVKTSSWSFSKLQDFSKCKRMFMLKHINKIPEPERPLPPGKTEHGNDRGTRVHENAEAYVRNEHDALCPEAEKHFSMHMDLLRSMYADGMVEMEEEWAFDKGWDVAPWKSGWVRMKVDALVHWSKTHASLIDFKTGRIYGNEIVHAQQLQLYAVSTFLRYPQLEHVTVADWYIDHGEIVERQFTRSQALRFKQNFHNQGMSITECDDFPTNANKFSCRWCPYKNTEHCTVGV